MQYPISSNVSIVWPQNINALNKLNIPKIKALPTNHGFYRPVTSLKPTIPENKILKFGDKMTLENILFVNKSINRQVSPIFYDWFTFSRNLHRSDQ